MLGWVHPTAWMRANRSQVPGNSLQRDFSTEGVWNLHRPSWWGSREVSANIPHVYPRSYPTTIAHHEVSIRSDHASCSDRFKTKYWFAARVQVRETQVTSLRLPYIYGPLLAVLSSSTGRRKRTTNRKLLNHKFGADVLSAHFKLMRIHSVPRCQGKRYDLAKSS